VGGPAALCPSPGLETRARGLPRRAAKSPHEGRVMQTLPETSLERR